MFYTAEELVAKAKQAEGFEEIPRDYWLCGIRMNEDDRKPNHFNDRTYLMRGEEIVEETTCTTVPGSPALLGKFLKYNKKGAAIIKSNIWMYDGFSYGLHNGKMPALRQVKKFWTYRDGDRDNVAEQLGEPTKCLCNTNFHANNYNLASKVVKRLIQGWSFGCWVVNNIPKYNKIIHLTKRQKFVSGIILDEFSI